jgi:hypothetical protein
VARDESRASAARYWTMASDQFPVSYSTSPSPTCAVTLVESRARESRSASARFC